MSSIVFTVTVFFAGWVFSRLKKWKSGFVFAVIFYIATAILSFVVNLVGLLVLATLTMSDSAIVAIDKVIGQSLFLGLLAPLVGAVLFKFILRTNTTNAK